MHFPRKVCKDGKAWGHRHTDHLPTAGHLEWIEFVAMGDLGGDTVDGSEILHQLRLVVFPIIYRVSYIPGGARVDQLPLFHHIYWG